ncbi:MAG TPA: hypothetical protein VGB79_10220 [Allosphingosinicella sp.]|jgi:hypothetical protein
MADQPSDTPPGATQPLPAASEAAEAAAAAKASNPNRTKQIVTGAALGIGSAALVAALLYANRSRKSDKRDD